MEEYTPDSEESKSEDLKNWFQENLRIIISVAIVIIIAGGIYSYSKRTESPIVAEQQDQTTDNSASDTTSTDNGTADTSGQKATVNNNTAKPEVSSATTSKETENSFVETAGRNGSLTVLARKATADYLEKNPDSSLTKEHKIYIEDYLRKHVSQKGGIRVGTSVEFSKDSISKAVALSKNLNASQLKNLQKYSARVTSL